MREIKFRAWDKNLREMFYDRDNVTVFSWPPEHHEIMQCTGLKDKNGKEIYEGDIYTVPPLPGNYQVFFYEGAFTGGKLLEESMPLNWTPGRRTELNPDKFSAELEIIGNIHENPELMEGKQ